MRRAFGLLLLLAPAILSARGAEGGAEGSADGSALLETVVPGESFFAGEPIRLTLRIGIDRAFFERYAVQMFQRELDVPVQVEAAWLKELRQVPGAVLRKAPDAGRGLSLALNGEVVEAAPAGEREMSGRRYTFLEIARIWIFPEPGEVQLAPPTLRFVHGTQFAEDLLGGRIAMDPRDAIVTGAAATFRVRELPAKGKPPGFQGAVGTFSVSAEATPRTLDAGEVLRFVLRIEGEGNLDLFPPPNLEGLQRFHLYGVLDDRGTRRRTITYDLAPLGPDANEVPPIPFAYFDPKPPGAYRTTRTPAIPLSVRTPPGTPPGPAPAPIAPPPAAGKGAPRPVWYRGVVLAPLAALVLLALFFLVVATRRSAGDRHDHHRARVVAADAAFRERAAEKEADPAALFAELLAAHLDCAAPAVIAPDLPERLASAGVPSDLASRTAALLERLVAARYGAAAPAADLLAEAHSLAAALEAHFHAPRPKE